MIQFCKRWAEEDKELSAIKRTRNILAGSMEDIVGVAVRINEDNLVLFKFREKPTNNNKVLQKRSPMGENQKMTILTQEVIRRLRNTSELLEDKEFKDILERYCQKLFNSGYREDQIRKIMIAGIRGWGSKVARCKAENKKLRKTARDSEEMRMRTKLTGRTTWFKKRRPQKKDWYPNGGGHKPGRKDKVQYTAPGSSPKSVLFIEQTPGGELATRLRELLQRLEPTIGIKIKVVERSGRTLQSVFPLTTIWDGAPCGRRKEECITCTQGAEIIPNCTQKSVLYENICNICIPSATGKEQIGLEEQRTDCPAIYIGETSRSIAERSREHWAGYIGGKEDNHMRRHQQMEHEGGPPNFTMRVIESHRTALSRQVGEAVRIRRRGGQGSILNSKTEYNRCHIPRLQVEEEEEAKEREQELEK